MSEQRTLAGHEALSADMQDLSDQLDKERALLKVSLHLLKRCRGLDMPIYLRDEIDRTLDAGSAYL